MQGGILARNQERSEDQKLVQSVCPREDGERQDQRAEVTVSREPFSVGTLSPVAPTGLALDATRSGPSERHLHCAADPPSVRRDWQRLPWKRDEVCLVQSLNRGQ